ncbi:MAG TPA: hypothetical protein VIB98_04750 [Gemmatimonadaceae bacterium]
MTSRAWLAAGAIALAGGAGSACHHHSHPAADAPALSDSLVGIVSVTGTSIAQRLVLRVNDQSHAFAASSADSAALSRLGGVEVVVRGTSRNDAFEVAAFEALRVDGAPVADGVLLRDGEHLALRTQHGRLALGNPPAAFDTLIGARVWVSGPLVTGPNSYGIIVPR